MSRFTAHNTDHHYNNSELAELNEAFEAIMADNASSWVMADADSTSYKSWQDHVAETLLARYAIGERGESLTR